MASPSDERKLDLWVEAKRARDYRLADQLRAELEARGIQPERVRPYVGGRGSQHGMGAPMAGGRGGGKGGKGGKGGGGRAPPSNIDPSVGDWHCQSCGNWNWARRRECNQCNAAKEGLMRVSGAASGTKRDGLAGGFKEYDEEESERRKRRAVEERVEIQERKAEKKKCQYCHRAACIC